jgi:hypothetical protein
MFEQAVIEGGSSARRLLNTLNVSRFGRDPKTSGRDFSLLFDRFYV